jgi:hypothetical protein
LNNDYEHLKNENSKLRDTIRMFRFHPKDRLDSIKRLFNKNELDEAKNKILELKHLFPQSNEANRVIYYESIIDRKKSQKYKNYSNKNTTGRSSTANKTNYYSNSGTVYVKGYHRTDGTYVKSHTRRKRK